MPQTTVNLYDAHVTHLVLFSSIKEISNDIVQYCYEVGGLTTQASSGPALLLIKVSSC